MGAVSWDNKRDKPIKKTDLFINDCKFAHFIFSISTLKPRFLISLLFLSNPDLRACVVLRCQRKRATERQEERERSKSVEL